jgi:hypothetical protein
MRRNTVLTEVRKASYRNLGSVVNIRFVGTVRYSKHLYIFISRRCTLMLCQASWLGACNLFYSQEVLGSATGRGVTHHDLLFRELSEVCGNNLKMVATGFFQLFLTS